MPCSRLNHIYEQLSTRHENCAEIHKLLAEWLQMQKRWHHIKTKANINTQLFKLILWEMHTVQTLYLVSLGNEHLQIHNTTKDVV